MGGPFGNAHVRVRGKDVHFSNGVMVGKCRQELLNVRCREEEEEEEEEEEGLQYMLQQGLLPLLVRREDGQRPRQRQRNELSIATTWRVAKKSNTKE